MIIESDYFVIDSLVDLSFLMFLNNIVGTFLTIFFLNGFEAVADTHFLKERT